MTDSPSDPPPPDETDAAGDPPEPKPPTRRRSRWVTAALAGAVAVVVVAVGLFGTRIFGLWGPESDPTVEATGTPTPTGPPSPFAGTPAEDFAEGAAGIVLPEAEAVGDFTADQVAEALEQVREALIAARLDRTMLVDHDPDPFLSLLAPDQQATVREAFDSANFGTFATWVAEATGLVPAGPRVAGQISYTTAVDGGLPVLEVETRFVWVYALEAADRGLGAGPVVVRDELVWWVRLDERWSESSRGLWLPAAVSRALGVDCDAYEESLLRPGNEPVTSTSEPADPIFDPEQSLESVDTC
jgi:hypothetical protein